MFTTIFVFRKIQVNSKGKKKRHLRLILWEKFKFGPFYHKPYVICLLLATIKENSEDLFLTCITSYISGSWLTLSVAYTISNSPRMVTEIPTAGPFTTATRGFGKSIKQSTKSLQTWKYKSMFKYAKVASLKYAGETGWVWNVLFWPGWWISHRLAVPLCPATSLASHTSFLPSERHLRGTCRVPQVSLGSNLVF